MNDTIFLLVKVEVKHAFPNVHEAITELQQKAVCRISDTTNVKVTTAQVMDYHLKSKL